jgi:hypothetical protein
VFAADVAARPWWAQDRGAQHAAQHGRGRFFLHAAGQAWRYLRVGQGGEGCEPLHNSRYDFNDEILPLGAACTPAWSSRHWRLPSPFFNHAIEEFDMFKQKIALASPSPLP